MTNREWWMAMAVLTGIGCMILLVAFGLFDLIRDLVHSL